MEGTNKCAGGYILMTNDEIAIKLTETEARSKSNTHRLDKVEERQDNLDSLVASVSAMAKEQENIKEDVTEIKTDVKALTEKPAKRWDMTIDTLIVAVAAALVGFLMAKLGISV
jgi:seryl-tRNA synthetase